LKHFTKENLEEETEGTLTRLMCSAMRSFPYLFQYIDI